MSFQTMDKLKQFLRGDETQDENVGIIDQFNETTTFSWNTRMKGFVICFVVGILLSLLGSFALFLNGGLKVFAVFYTVGNIISMLSTCFLMGPFKQIKKMFNPTRLLATIIVIVSFILTLIAAIVLEKALLALLFIIIQSLAMTWYSLSYIPYARDVVKKTVLACV